MSEPRSEEADGGGEGADGGGIDKERDRRAKQEDRPDRVMQENECGTNRAGPGLM